jgi:hypothetical protein
VRAYLAYAEDSVAVSAAVSCAPRRFGVDAMSEYEERFRPPECFRSGSYLG